LTLEHRLSNSSSVDRIHLVVDCITNEWLLDLFRSPDATYRECEATVKRYSDEEAMLIVAQLRTLGTEVADRMAEELEQQYSKA
ncbi:MAG TPA: hypothetical protein VFH43_05045, partial [Candidatus Kapabacteria bacterium]|nr:hypothetical protein [Candidatus Kapabacteria bacterium]